tara:strand:+ start:1561 stop:1860 length:300 start_codon:yes stop_codon:yes gene_type:complete
MSRNLPAPFFPYPPIDYQQQYFAEIVRAFGTYIEQQRNPGEGRVTKITMTAVPSETDVSLETGAVFEVRGVLKISKVDIPHPQGTGGTMGIGSVSVTTG